MGENLCQRTVPPEVSGRGAETCDALIVSHICFFRCAATRARRAWVECPAAAGPDADLCRPRPSTTRPPRSFRPVLVTSPHVPQHEPSISTSLVPFDLPALPTFSSHPPSHDTVKPLASMATPNARYHRGCSDVHVPKATARSRTRPLRSICADRQHSSLLPMHMCISPFPRAPRCLRRFATGFIARAVPLCRIGTWRRFTRCRKYVRR